MTATITIISDTHFSRWDEVPPKIREAVRDADIAVHCGDIVRQDVVDGMRNEARRVGHSSRQLRPARPQTVASVHRGHRGRGSQAGSDPSRLGGPEFPLEELLPDFPEPVDAILFGHLHETINETRDGNSVPQPGSGV